LPLQFETRALTTKALQQGIAQVLDYSWLWQLCLRAVG
jgi:hypothetical protein